MRISTKLTLSLTTIGLITFIGYGLYDLSIERQDLAQGISQQTQLFGKSLQIAIENAVRDKQIEDIEELLKGLEQIEPDLKIRVYDLQGKAFPDAIGSSFKSDFQNRLQAALKNGKKEQFFFPLEDPEYITLLLPLQNEQGEKLGILAVVRSLNEMRRDLDTTRRNLLVSAVAFVLIAVPLCTIICLIYIGWPLKRLIGGMTRIKDGNFSPLPLKNQQDEIGVLLVAFNVMATELENALRQLKEEAQSRRHVQAALQEADKLITVGQLSAGLAHEIGSPLQILKGRAEYLLLCANQPEEVIRHAGILVSQTERITRIVQQLLEFTRRRPPHFTHCDLRVPVNAVLNLLEYEALRKQVELSFETVNELPLIFADSDGIQQIVLNLITNALSATDSGGHIVVTVSPAPTVRVSTQNTAAAEAVQLIVRDDGCGMSPEVLEHMFEPFFTTRHEQGGVGVGLGLAVARSIVIAHNGTIKADSSPGQGSAVTIIFPVEGRHHVIN
jgi:signal transduction histidine kinase